jgi:hypothetical protein
MNDNTQTDDGQQGGAKAQDDTEYKIPQAALDKHPDLVKMIKSTESMSKEEREYWFQILPIMTDEQVVRLRKILEQESKQLAMLDSKYQNELGKLNQKHEQEWNEFEKKQSREKRKTQEASHEQEEAANEAALLNELENL